MELFEQAKRVLLYAGVDRQDWERVRPEIHRSNRTRLTVFSSVASAFLLLMVVVTFSSSTYHFQNYLWPLVLCLVMLAGARFAKKRPVLLQHLVVIFIAMLFAFSINISVFSNPQQTAGTFLAFLLAVPLLLILRPIVNIGLITLFDAVFFWSAALVKDNPAILFTDIGNGLIFAAISMILSTYMTCIAVENFVIKDRMTRLARHDQLTRLQNRNAYEMSLAGYPARAGRSLSCVYVDANGLHELNNRAGHEEGDRMLQWVAAALQAQFGPGDTFRVGGDEFIAFAPDWDQARLEQALDAFRRQVEQGGFEVSVGVCTQNAGEIDTYTLVKQAEALMFDNKEAFYAETGRTGR